MRSWWSSAPCSGSTRPPWCEPTFAACAPSCRSSAATDGARPARIEVRPGIVAVTPGRPRPSARRDGRRGGLRPRTHRDARSWSTGRRSTMPAAATGGGPRRHRVMYAIASSVNARVVAARPRRGNRQPPIPSLRIPNPRLRDPCPVAGTRGLSGCALWPPSPHGPRHSVPLYRRGPPALRTWCGHWIRRTRRRVLRARHGIGRSSAPGAIVPQRIRCVRCPYSHTRQRNAGSYGGALAPVC